MAVDGRGVDRHVGVHAVERGEPLRAREQAHEADRARPGRAQPAHRRDGGVAGGEHRVEHDHVTLRQVVRHLEVVLHRLERLRIAEEAHVADPRAGQDAQHAVEQPVARAQDRHQHDLLAVEQADGGRRHRRLRGHLVRRQLAGHLVGQQHADLGEQAAELRGAGVPLAHQAELVLDQRVADLHHLPRPGGGLPEQAGHDGLRGARPARAASGPRPRLPPARG